LLPDDGGNDPQGSTDPDSEPLTAGPTAPLARSWSAARIESGGAIWLRDRREVPVGILDDLKGKAQRLVNGNEQAIKDGIEKAGDFVDSKTGGKYADKVDSVQQGAAGLVDKVDGKPDTAPVADEPPVAGEPPAAREPRQQGL
jgi:MT0933-like antitoxin protein